jgi:hypothetical protein
MRDFDALGFARVPALIDSKILAGLAEIATSIPSHAGGRRWAAGELKKLLRHPAIARLTRAVDSLLSGTRVLRVVAFKKDEGANWFVPTHQDRSIPIPSADLPPDFSRATRKAGGWQAEAPIEVLQAMRNVRVFIDDATPEDGPLEVIPGSHRLGRIKQAEIPGIVAQSAWHPLTGKAGDVVVLSPLLLHRSVRAVTPLGRRVLQMECTTTDVARKFGLI